MDQDDYPGLYAAADEASNEAQRHLLTSHKANGILLVAGAAAALVSTMTAWVALVSAVLFLGSLAVYLWAQHLRFQDHWYQARALAESIKTATWRLVIGAEPFAGPDQDVNLRAFRALLEELLQENRGIGLQLAGDWADREQVTSRMRAILNSSFEERRQLYLTDRIRNQRGWYTRRAKENRAASRKFLTWIVALYGLAIVLLLVRIAAPAAHPLPIEVLAVIAGSLIGWKQLRRFDELASAYGLTAHEVGIIESRFDAVDSDSSLSSFVSDAENAFSREHTQWAARRDHR
ncbi:MAG: hypothetical protein AMXMBFR53_18540 [Gemmatimonadota bacterium]